MLLNEKRIGVVANKLDQSFIEHFTRFFGNTLSVLPNLNR